jgi:hypothetical protein
MPIHGHPIPRPPGRGKALWVVCWKPTLNTFAIILEGRIVAGSSCLPLVQADQRTG